MDFPPCFGHLMSQMNRRMVQGDSAENLIKRLGGAQEKNSQGFFKTPDLKF